MALPAFAALGGIASKATAAQVHGSEFPAPRSPPPACQTVPAKDAPDAPVAGAGTVGAARAIAFDQMALRTMANGGESRDIAHGTLATGETVNLHQSVQVVGATPSPLHVIHLRGRRFWAGSVRRLR